MRETAQAFWVTAPGQGEIREEAIGEPNADEVRVGTLFSGVSRGTETLVFRGEVPPSQRTIMRAPHQSGDFPAPVKYGYLNVGVVEAGAAELAGRTVFCLYPHQSRYVVPAGSVIPVPHGVPAARAVLAGTVETAVNALWDAAPLVGDRICVIGAGMVGCCVARLAAGIPGARVTLVDVDGSRGAVAEALGVRFSEPDTAPDEQDVVVHCSATASGLQLALDRSAPETTVLELSWYGDTTVSLRLGGNFHSQRLGVRASQVGTVAPARRTTRSHRDRLTLALELLRDPAFDALLTGRCRLAELPTVLEEMAGGRRPGICQVVEYEG